MLNCSATLLPHVSLHQMAQPQPYMKLKAMPPLDLI